MGPTRPPELPVQDEFQREVFFHARILEPIRIKVLVIKHPITQKRSMPVTLI